MTVRAFSGTSWIQFPGINLTGAFSFAALVKMMDTTVPTGWQAIASSTDSSTHSQLSHYVRGTVGTSAPQQGVPLLDITLTATGSNGTTKAITNPASWKILVVTKAAGSTIPRFHVFPIGGAWTQEAGDTSSGNPAAQASGKFYIGAYADPSTAVLADFCNMRMALYGVWNGTALSDVQVQALATGLATSAWTGHAVAPASVWEFTQASTGTAVNDLVGTNHQAAITGTSVTAGDDPAGWTFASGGGATPSLLVPPRRRVTRGLIIR